MLRISVVSALIFANLTLCERAGGDTTSSAPKSTPVRQAQIDSIRDRYPIVDGSDIRFSRPYAPEGLSLTKLGPIVQDKQGFLWFGSQHGLFRFDGYSYKEFVHEPTNPHSLSCPLILTLFEDRDGALWIGCERFLDRLDLKTETFTHFPIPFVVHVSQDRTGVMWLSTSSGFYAFDPATGRYNGYFHDSANPFSLSSNDVRSSGEDREGQFWIANTAGLDEFDRSTGRVLLHISFPGSSYVFAFYEDRQGVFWVYRSSGASLARLDRSTNTLKAIEFSMPIGITAMIEDQNGTLWLGTASAGLLRFDREHQRFIRYGHNIADPESIGEDSVSCLLLDNEGHMWVALGGMGLTSFAVDPLPFKRYRHDFGNPDAKGEPFVGAIFEDEAGALWIGTHEALTRVDRKDGRSTSFHLGDPKTGSDVISICEDHSGVLWIGTYDHGLFRFDRSTGQFKRFRHNPTDPNSLSDDIVPRLLVDHRGTLWAGTDSGLDRFDEVHGKFIRYRRDQLSRDHYLEVVEDSKGLIWLGTVSSGLQRFDPATGQFVTFEHEPERVGSLSDNRVNSIHFDRAGAMWVGTQDGLDRFDQATGQFTVYTRSAGLPGSTVGCVLEDRQGNIWMSTNNGVASLDRSTNSFRNYSTADGLPGLDLTGWGACFNSRSGEMFFGGFAGATSFFPNKAKESLFIPPVVLTDFRVSGASVPVGGRSILKNTINYTNSITLGYKQNIFAIAFSGLSYKNPVTNRYRYRLEGLDQHWNEARSDERIASYTTLPHGVYKFRVQAAESRGNWSEPGRELTIEVLPPWWETNWFRTLLVIGTIGALSMFYRIRMLQLEHQFHKMLEVRVEERTRIARDIHDTLLQSVNALLLRLQTVSNVLPAKPDEAKRRIDRAIEETSDTITEGRDTLNDLRSSGSAAIDIDQAISNFARELLNGSTSEVVPEIHVQVEGASIPMNPMVRDEVYRIVTEAVRNAVRHAEATRIEVEIRYDLHRFRTRIGDNGRGIDPSIQNLGHKPGHWGLRGMKERAKLVGATIELWSQVNVGTEVDLSIPAASAYAKQSSVRRSLFSYFR